MRIVLITPDPRNAALGLQPVTVATPSAAAVQFGAGSVAKRMLNTLSAMAAANATTQAMGLADAPASYITSLFTGPIAQRSGVFYSTRLGGALRYGASVTTGTVDTLVNLARVGDSAALGSDGIVYPLDESGDIATNQLTTQLPAALGSVVSAHRGIFGWYTHDINTLLAGANIASSTTGFTMLLKAVAPINEGSWINADIQLVFDTVAGTVTGVVNGEDNSGIFGVPPDTLIDQAILAQFYNNLIPPNGDNPNINQLDQAVAMFGTCWFGSDYLFIARPLSPIEIAGAWQEINNAYT